ncbi:MAG TPA: LCP family protein [Candidatus Saccharimonadales bacterium]|nr:LCP family protein [Candidatus Saccharimonadales bacterium]
MNDNKDDRPIRRPHYASVDGILRSPVKHSGSHPHAAHSSQTPVSDDSLASMPEKKPLTHAEAIDQQSNSLLHTALPNPRYAQRSSGERTPGKKKNKLLRFWGRDRNKWSLRRRIVTGAVVLIAGLIGFGAWDAWQLDHKVNHLAVGNLSTSVGGAENILVAGSTNRCNLKVQNAQWGFCSQGVTGVNSDIIFIVHIVPKTNSISLLSIPRDTFVPNARSGDQAFKIDAALYEGPTQLVKAVEEDFGIPIQHYAEVGFDGFVNIVNAVGGIKMDFPMPVYDSDSYLNVKTAGCQLLNGVEALQVVRSRHLQYKPPGVTTNLQYLWPQEPESDIARIARTHEFLRVLASTVAAQNLSNPFTVQKIVDAIAPQVQVDSGFSTSAMLQLGLEFHTVNINSVPQYTLPISTTSFGDYEYGGTDYGDVVFPSEAVDRQVINEFLGVTNSTDTMTGKSLPTPASFSVSVVNGSGISGQATQTSTALQALGFNVVGQPQTATPLSSEAVETVVNYAGPSTEADAEAVARQLTGPVILSENAGQVTSSSEVTVLTGTGLAVNAPPGKAASSSSSSTPSTPAAPAAPIAVTGLEPASAPMQPLSAWDPRACS